MVVTTQGVVLVDTGNNPPETRILQNFIKSVTDQPVRYVVISQNHGDHQGGTPLFSPPAHVIVHDRVVQGLGGVEALSDQGLAAALLRARRGAQERQADRHRASASTTA